jgi:hypothetical protein
VGKLFQRNIDNKGRLIRGIGGLILAVGGVIIGQFVFWVGVGMILSAGFVLFEAVRGWCALRACGIRTRF